MLFGQVAVVTTERLRLELGVNESLSLDDPEVHEAWRAARQDRGASDRLAVAVALAAGRQLAFQYPSSSLLWDCVNDELSEVLIRGGLNDSAPGTWTGPVDEARTLVVELTRRPSAPADERRFTLRWGLVLPKVPFCRHCERHTLGCCAIGGGLGALQSVPSDHAFILSVGLLTERLAAAPAALVGRADFCAQVQHLLDFARHLGVAGDLAEVLRDRPWRAGIGVAGQLRDADSCQLRRLLT